MFGTSAKTRISSQAARSVHKVMHEINSELAKIHKVLGKHINQDQYIHATNFAQQYISYTSLWNMKFSYNMESPEVALIQLLHLDYIFKHELPTEFTKERELFYKMQQLFNGYKPYSDEMIKKRKQKMLDYIQDQA